MNKFQDFTILRFHNFKCVAACLMLALMASCSGSEAEEPNTPTNEAKPRQITITQTDTRATLNEVDQTLTAKWTAGDGLKYCNLSTLELDRLLSQPPTQGPLEASSSAVSSQFTGTVTCGNGDKLAVIYPAEDFGLVGAASAKYTIDLSGQDGTLSRLATNYHYVYGVATVTSVTETTANATMGKMKSLLTVCKFSFVDETGTPINISSLEICYANEDTYSNAGTYPQSATVTADETQSNVHAVPDAGSSSALSVSPTPSASEVYVALLPTSGERTFNFTVSDGTNTFTGTATATLNAGEYVVATGLKLTKNNS